MSYMLLFYKAFIRMGARRLLAASSSPGWYRALVTLVFIFTLAEHAPGIELTDDTGKKFTFSAPATRVVSLAPGLTEIVFAVGAGSLLVGVTEYCNYPEAARRIPRIGGFNNPNVEKILSLSPDLVLATKDGNPRETVKRLDELGIRVFTVYETKITDIPRSMEIIGRLLGRQDEALAAGKEFKNTVEDIRRMAVSLPRKKVLFLYGLEPLVASGAGTFADDAIAICGGTNIFSGETGRYLKTNPEQVMARKPQIAVLSEMGEAGPDKVRAFENITGLKLETIHGDLINRPGPRMAEGLKRLYGIIHPEQTGK
jgi:iron complex transport system substrate-binding protein